MLENVGPVQRALGTSNPKQNSSILPGIKEFIGSTVLWLRYILKYVLALFRDNFIEYI